MTLTGEMPTPSIEKLGEAPTLSVEKILFATDFSDASKVAKSYAKGLAQRYGSTLAVVHIYDPSKNATYEDGVLAPLEADRIKMRQSKLEAIETELRLAGIKNTSILRTGHPASKELLSIMEVGRTDMLVIGTHSRTGLERFVVGSIAEDLIRRSALPVLTIGPHVRAPKQGKVEFTNIVFATDFSARAAKAAAFAISFAQDSRAHLYFCHVLDEAGETTERRELADQIFRADLKRMVPESTYELCSPHCVVEHGSAPEGILELANRVHADLIVLGPRKSTFALTHIERGVSLDVIAGAECPVLTIC